MKRAASALRFLCDSGGPEQPSLLFVQAQYFRGVSNSSVIAALIMAGPFIVAASVCGAPASDVVVRAKGKGGTPGGQGRRSDRRS